MSVRIHKPYDKPILFWFLTCAFAGSVTAQSTVPPSLKEQQRRQIGIQNKASSTTGTFAGLIAEFGRNGLKGSDVDVLGGINLVLHQVSDSDMPRVVAHLEQAQLAANIPEARNEALVAFGQQKMVIIQLRQAVLAYYQELALEELARRAQELGDRQSRNLHEGISMVRGAERANRRNIVRRDLAVSEQLQVSEQESLHAEIGDILKALEHLAKREDMTLDTRPLKAKRLVEDEQLQGNTSRALEELKAKRAMSALSYEKNSRDTLWKLAQLLQPDQDKLERLLALKSKLDDLILEQGRVIVATDQLDKPIEGLDQATLEKDKNVRRIQSKIGRLKKQAATNIRRVDDAIKKLEAAVGREITKAEQDINPDPELEPKPVPEPELETALEPEPEPEGITGIYVDAIPADMDGNTVSLPDHEEGGWYQGPTDKWPPAGDGTWFYFSGDTGIDQSGERKGRGIENALFANYSNFPAAPPLQTTITGLEASVLYDVYVHFLAAPWASGQYGIKAGFLGEELPLFSDNHDDARDTKLPGEGINTFEGLIGNIEAVDGKIVVEIDISGRERSFYAGLSYAPTRDGELMLGLGKEALVQQREPENWRSLKNAELKRLKNLREQIQQESLQKHQQEQEKLRSEIRKVYDRLGVITPEEQAMRALEAVERNQGEIVDRTDFLANQLQPLAEDVFDFLQQAISPMQKARANLAADIDGAEKKSKALEEEQKALSNLESARDRLHEIIQEQAQLAESLPETAVEELQELLSKVNDLKQREQALKDSSEALQKKQDNQGLKSSKAPEQAAISQDTQSSQQEAQALSPRAGQSLSQAAEHMQASEAKLANGYNAPLAQQAAVDALAKAEQQLQGAIDAMTGNYLPMAHTAFDMIAQAQQNVADALSKLESPASIMQQIQQRQNALAESLNRNPSAPSQAQTSASQAAEQLAQSNIGSAIQSMQDTQDAIDGNQALGRAKEEQAEIQELAERLVGHGAQPAASPLADASQAIFPLTSGQIGALPVAAASALEDAQNALAAATSQAKANQPSPSQSNSLSAQTSLAQAAAALSLAQAGLGTVPGQGMAQGWGQGPGQGMGQGQGTGTGQIPSLGYGRPALRGTGDAGNWYGAGGDNGWNRSRKGTSTFIGLPQRKRGTLQQTARETYSAEYGRMIEQYLKNLSDAATN